MQTAHDDRAPWEQVKEFPISGFIVKDDSPAHLLDAIRAVELGEPWFSV